MARRGGALVTDNSSDPGFWETPYRPDHAMAKAEGVSLLILLVDADVSLINTQKRRFPRDLSEPYSALATSFTAAHPSDWR